MSATAAAPQAPPEITLETQLKFEAEIQARMPETLVKRYEMPMGIKQIKAVYMRELTSRDELDASIMADASMSKIEKSSNKLTGEAERREMVRAAIVGIVRREPLAYVHCNDRGMPFVEMDKWSAKLHTALSVYYGELNGVPMSELNEGIKGARTLGATMPPTPAIQP